MLSAAIRSPIVSHINIRTVLHREEEGVVAGWI